MSKLKLLFKFAQMAGMADISYEAYKLVDDFFNSSNLTSPVGANLTEIKMIISSAVCTLIRDVVNYHYAPHSKIEDGNFLNYLHFKEKDALNLTKVSDIILAEPSVLAKIKKDGHLFYNVDIKRLTSVKELVFKVKKGIPFTTESFLNEYEDEGDYPRKMIKVKDGRFLSTLIAISRDVQAFLKGDKLQAKFDILYQRNPEIPILLSLFSCSIFKDFNHSLSKEFLTNSILQYYGFNFFEVKAGSLSSDCAAKKKILVDSVELAQLVNRVNESELYSIASSCCSLLNASSSFNNLKDIEVILPINCYDDTLIDKLIITIFGKKVRSLYSSISYVNIKDKMGSSLNYLAVNSKDGKLGNFEEEEDEEKDLDSDGYDDSLTNNRSFKSVMANELHYKDWERGIEVSVSKSSLNEFPKGDVGLLYISEDEMLYDNSIDVINLKLVKWNKSEGEIVCKNYEGELIIFKVTFADNDFYKDSDTKETSDYKNQSNITTVLENEELVVYFNFGNVAIANKSEVADFERIFKEWVKKNKSKASISVKLLTSADSLVRAKDPMSAQAKLCLARENLVISLLTKICSKLGFRLIVIEKKTIIPDDSGPKGEKNARLRKVVITLIHEDVKELEKQDDGIEKVEIEKTEDLAVMAIFKEPISLAINTLTSPLSATKMSPFNESFFKRYADQNVMFSTNATPYIKKDVDKNSQMFFRNLNTLDDFRGEQYPQFPKKGTLRLKLKAKDNTVVYTTQNEFSLEEHLKYLNQLYSLTEKGTKPFIAIDSKALINMTTSASENNGLIPMLAFASKAPLEYIIGSKEHEKGFDSYGGEYFNSQMKGRLIRSDFSVPDEFKYDGCKGYIDKTHIFGPMHLFPFRYCLALYMGDAYVKIASITPEFYSANGTYKLTGRCYLGPFLLEFHHEKLIFNWNYSASYINEKIEILGQVIPVGLEGAIGKTSGERHSHLHLSIKNIGLTLITADLASKLSSSESRTVFSEKLKDSEIIPSNLLLQ